MAVYCPISLLSRFLAPALVRLCLCLFGSCLSVSVCVERSHSSHVCKFHGSRGLLETAHRCGRQSRTEGQCMGLICVLRAAGLVVITVVAAFFVLIAAKDESREHGNVF